MSFVNKPLTDIMDCTRASTATYVDATGRIRTAGVNEPRVDYSSGQGRLLVEEARTNLLTWSEDFSKDAWIKENCNIVPQTISNPIDNNSFFVESSNTSTSIVRQTYNASVSGEFTLTFFLKAKERNEVNIRINDAGTLENRVETRVNLTNGTTDTPLALGTFTNASATITPFQNGWFKCSIKGNCPSSIGLQVRSMASGNVVGEGYYLKAAQLEQASTPSSYIPTEASAVTRAADRVSRVLGDEFNPFEGTVYFDININSISISSTEFIHESDTGYRFLYRLNSSPLVFRTFDGSNVQTLNGSATVGRHKVVVSYKAGMAIASVDGTITPSFTFNPTNFGSVFGVNTRITSGLSSKATDFNKVRYYPKALSQSECEELTRI